MMFALNEDELDEGDKGKVRAYWYGEYLLRLYAVSNGIPAYDFNYKMDRCGKKLKATKRYRR